MTRTSRLALTLLLGLWLPVALVAAWWFGSAGSDGRHAPA